MHKIPDQILKIAREFLTEEYESDYPSYAKLAREGKGSFTLCSIRAIANAVIKERERCIEICSAEREWGGNIEDVQNKIERGQQPRQIPGWNCPYEDERDERLDRMERR